MSQNPDDKRRGPKPKSHLTSRQIQVMDLLIEGNTFDQAAARLGLVSRCSIGTHVSNVKDKLGAATLSQAVALYLSKPIKKDQGPSK